MSGSEKSFVTKNKKTTTKELKMINSMTAYARAEKTTEQVKVSIEIRSYNHRHLDFTVRLPHNYLELEDKIKNLATEKVSRGRLEVKLQIIDESEDAYGYEINEPKAQAYHEALLQLKDRFDIDPAISLELLAGAGGIIVPAETKRDIQAHWPIVADCFNEALDNLIAMRRKEGDFMSKDLAGRLDFIEKRLVQIKKESIDLFGIYQERLKERIRLLTKGMIEIDPARVAQEAAFIADKSDISEEIVRSESHIQQFRMVMYSEEPAGRKLNFLLQELNREFNTIGSKTEKVSVSHMIVEVKSELEKIREQVQNIE